MSAALPRLRVERDGDRFADLTDAQRAQVTERRSLVHTWRQTCDTFVAADRTRREATATFLTAHPEISRATLYRWAKLLDTEGPIGLLDARSTAARIPTGQASVSPEVWERFKRLWLTIQRRTVALCWQIVKAETEDNGWTWPTLRTVQLRAKRDLPPIVSDYFRFGEREWMRRFGPKMRRDYSQYRAGELWDGDFHPFDVFCRKSERDPTIVRPLLSAFQDLRTRMVVGWQVCLRECQDTVLIAFRRGVEKHGPPWHAVIDNGKVYRAKGISGGRPGKRIADEAYVRSVMGGLNVAVHFSLPFNPDSKPIERWFRTLEEQFCATFPTYCGSQKDDRFKHAWKLAHDHPERCPTVDELRERCAEWIEAYHQTRHSAPDLEGLSPAKAFDTFNPIPRAIAPDGALDLLLMRTTKAVKVTKFGVRYNGIEYGANDPHLFKLQGQEVVLRIDPDDAGSVVVCDLEGKPICKATNNRLALTGVNQENVADGMKAKQRAKRLIKQIAGGDTRAALDDVSTAAIKAKLAAAESQPIDDLAAATGTDDATPRNVRPLRSDFAESAARFNARVDPPIDPEPEPTLTDLDDLFDEEPEPPVEEELDLADVLDEIDD